jgi:RNA recognition motif-containing protein
MNIYVGNLAPEVTEEELKQEFAAFGKVTSVSIIKDNLLPLEVSKVDVSIVANATTGPG